MERHESCPSKNQSYELGAFWDSASGNEIDLVRTLPIQRWLKKANFHVMIWLFVFSLFPLALLICV